MEIRFGIDDDYMKELEKDLGIKKASQIASGSLALLKWAIEQKKHGREIVAATDKGPEFVLVMPMLQSIKKEKTAEQETE